MPVKRDYTGFRNGKLVAIEPAGRNPAGLLQWLCQCDCGNTSVVVTGNMQSSRSCGCEKISKPGRGAKHGHCGTPTYNSWCSMKRRCGKRRGYEHISYCERWERFESFLEDMGERPGGTTLDRVDTNGNYAPENCRWATPREQCNNKRNNVLLTIDGVTYTIAEWGRIAGIGRFKIWSRYNSGWTPKEAVWGRKCAA